MLGSGAKFGGVAVNVTARHLADIDFRKAVVDQLEANSVPPGDLQVEVTEQVLMEASNSAMTGLRSLRDSRRQDRPGRLRDGLLLARLPAPVPARLRQDRQVVHRRPRHRPQRDRAIVSAIIVVAHALDLTVVAEGVELPSQREVLIDLGCDRAQGFLYAPSGPPEAVEIPVLAWPSPPPTGPIGPR